MFFQFCSTNDEATTVIYSFLPIDTINIPIDSTVNYAQSFGYTEFSGNRLLSGVIPRKNINLLYNIDKQKIEKKINLSFEGDQGVGSAIHIQPLNWDTILIIPAFSKSIYIYQTLLLK